MKHGDLVRSLEGFMVGKVINTDTECSIRSLEDDENRWIVQASHVSQFKKYWRVIRPSPEDDGLNKS
jgi:hypothetical protein